jgi:uncharacterized protein YprB with RNaseH-like and TPR domain
MSKWTEKELTALRIAGRNYLKFGEMTNFSKTYNAFEVKSRRVNFIDPFLDLDEASLAIDGPNYMPQEIKEALHVPTLGPKFPTPEVVNFNIAFFDIEATDLKANFGRMLCMSVADMFGNITTLRADDPQLKGSKIRDDSKLAVASRDLLEAFDIICGWNSKAYDVPFIDARLLIAGERPLRKDLMHVDPMWKAGQFSLALQSRRLDSVAKTFRLENQKTDIEWEFWMDAAMGDSDALNYVVTHCESDVKVLRSAFHVLKPLIKNIHR